MSTNTADKTDWLRLATRKKPANFNAMTEKLLRSGGWEVELTQSYNAALQLSKDLWGFADLIAFTNRQPYPVLLVQACGTGDRTKRMRKILSSDVAAKWIASGDRWLWLVHWSKRIEDGKKVQQWTARTDVIDVIDFKRFRDTGEVPRCR